MAGRGSLRRRFGMARVYAAPPLPQSPNCMTKPTHRQAIILGLGYTGRAIAEALLAGGWQVAATARTAPRMAGVRGLAFDGTAHPELQDALSGADLVIGSIPPSRDGRDPALDRLTLPPATVIYLSATSVYGDRDGQWAFEGEPPTPTSTRGRRRADAELQWWEAGAEAGAATHILRLAGIYGPTLGGEARSAFGKMERAVLKPGHTVNRIHVRDIARLVLRIAAGPRPGLYNVADGRPSPPEEVVRAAARIAGAPAPREIGWQSPELSPMARSFYAETKRIDISHTRATFGWEPLHTDVEAALRAIWAERSV